MVLQYSYHKKMLNLISYNNMDIINKHIPYFVRIRSNLIKLRLQLKKLFYLKLIKYK